MEAETSLKENEAYLQTEAYEPYTQPLVEQDPPRLMRRIQKIGLAAASVLLAAPPFSPGTANAETGNPDSASEMTSETTIVVETYNILGSNHTGHASAKRRARLATSVIKGAGTAPKADIIGFQEMEPDQRKMFKARLPNYAAYPKLGEGRVNNSIFYDKDKFKLIVGGIVKYPYYGDAYNQKSGSAPWVLLQERSTKKEIGVIDFHGVAFNTSPGSDKGGAIKRYRAAKIIGNWVDKMDENVPEAARVVLTDANSTNILRLKPDKYTPRVKDTALVGNGGRSKLPYCEITSEPKKMGDTFDIMKGRRGSCPSDEQNPRQRYTVDWVFASPEHFNVLAWKQLKTRITQQASDHYPVAATLKLK